jgi:hypothetical protein
MLSARSSVGTGRVEGVRRLLLVSAAAVLLALSATAAFAYPKTLFDAVQKAYAPRKAHIESFCHEQIGSKVYVLVDVTLVKSGKSRSAAFEYKKAGWFGIWRDGKITAAVVKSQRPRVRSILKELHRFCG